MKKGYMVLCLLLALVFSFGAKAETSKSQSFGRYEAYGLCVTSGLLEYDKDFDMDKFVSLEDYEKITKFWFGFSTVLTQSPTNSDAIYDISWYAPNVNTAKATITSFKDFGFIKKEHRNAYKTMCRAGFLNKESEFLFPNDKLTYGVLFDILINFDALHGFDVTCGMITDSFSDKNKIVIIQNTDKSDIRYEFDRKHGFYVHDKDAVSPYSYNLKRGMNAKIYSKDNEIVYVSINNKTTSIGNDTHILSGKIYLLNEYENKIIFSLTTEGTYDVYLYDENTMVYKNDIKYDISDINNMFTDKNCYFILDKKTNIIKYININS